MFVAPGLTPKERRYLLAFLPGALVCFAAGLAFGYFVLTPPALHFLLTFGDDVAVPLIKISNIVNLMVRLLFWMGLAFETPLVMYLLALLGIVNVRKLSRFRRFWVVIAFILAAIITPTFDPVNQALGGRAADSPVRTGHLAGADRKPWPGLHRGHHPSPPLRLNDSLGHKSSENPPPPSPLSHRHIPPLTNLPRPLRYCRPPTRQFCLSAIPASERESRNPTLTGSNGHWLDLHTPRAPRPIP